MVKMLLCMLVRCFRGFLYQFFNINFPTPEEYWQYCVAGGDTVMLEGSKSSGQFALGLPIGPLPCLGDTGYPLRLLQL
jgi:hypothetical protein